MQRARGVFAAGFLLFLGACGVTKPIHAKDSKATAGSPAAQQIAVDAERRIELRESLGRQLGDGLIVEAVFALRSTDRSFGGLSGLWIADDGARMIAVSDIGQRWQASLSHNADGRLTDLDGWTAADLPLHPEDRDRKPWHDSEALARDAAGGLIVAYESEHRLRRWREGDLDAVPERLVLPQGLGDRSNSGIEALSTLEDGRLFALAERVGAPGGGGLMGWVIDGQRADDLVYVPGDGFSPTGAARLENTVYVVERKFSMLGGFRTRIVTVATDAIRPGARVQGTELAAFRIGDFGENFEGISVRRGPDGRIFLYLLADDNFAFFQETLLIQLSLSTEGLID